MPPARRSPAILAVRNLVLGAAILLLGVWVPAHDWVRGSLIAVGLAIVFAGLLVLVAGPRRR